MQTASVADTPRFSPAEPTYPALIAPPAIAPTALPFDEDAWVDQQYHVAQLLNYPSQCSDNEWNYFGTPWNL